MLPATRDPRHVAVQQIVNKGGRLYEQGCRISLAKFAILIASKRVNLSLLCEYGRMVSATRYLQDSDVPRALLRFSIVLLMRLEP